MLYLLINATIDSIMVHAVLYGEALVKLDTHYDVRILETENCMNHACCRWEVQCILVKWKRQVSKQQEWHD